MRVRKRPVVWQFESARARIVVLQVRARARRGRRHGGVCQAWWAVVVVVVDVVAKLHVAGIDDRGVARRARSVCSTSGVEHLRVVAPASLSEPCERTC